MTRPALLLLVAAASVTTLSFAEARDGCGRGWFWNGRACVQQDYDDGPPQYRPQYESGYHGPRGYGYEPPCEPGKRRVIINGNSQCRYPGEALGGGGGGYRGYHDNGGGRRYHPNVIGEGPRFGCAPGQVRVVDGSNGSCRPAQNYIR